jgi:hypothetical protein
VFGLAAAGDLAQGEPLVAAQGGRDGATTACYCMHMSVLDRRVQILLDPAQYADVEREAARTGRSVAAVIREAIAARLASGEAARSAAAARLLQSADSDDAVGEDWEQSKAALEGSLGSKLP